MSIFKKTKKTIKKAKNAITGKKHKKSKEDSGVPAATYDTSLTSSEAAGIILATGIVGCLGLITAAAIEAIDED